MELFPLVRADNAERVKAFIRENPGIDLNIKNEQGQSPLYWATELPHTDVARVLLQAGADVNLTEQHGFTSLHLAAFIGNEDMVNLLLESGADFNKKNNSGSTTLHLAAKNNHPSIVRALLAKGADRNVRDDKGSLPIDYAKTPEVQAAFNTTPITKSPPSTPKVAQAGGSSIASPSTSASQRKEPTSGKEDKKSASQRSEKIVQLKKTIDATNDINVLRRIANVLCDTVTAEQNKLHTTSEKYHHEKNRTICTKCKEEPRDTVLLPCSHLLFCGKCVVTMQGVCANCSTPIDGRIKVSLSTAAPPANLTAMENK